MAPASDLDEPPKRAKVLDGEALALRFREVRGATVALTAPLSPEDCNAQSMPDASPAKWHLAHTTWFFETFVLGAEAEPFDPAFRELFNSYYNAVGEQYSRPHRGLLTRPTLSRVMAYRGAIDARILEALEAGSLEPARLSVLELGIHHEQQHQELILTDVLHLFSCNPLWPVYREGLPEESPEDEQVPELAWNAGPDGLQSVGHPGVGFGFDNEGPRHNLWVGAHELGSRLVTNGEYEAFVEDGGYRRADLWLSEGWDLVQREGWESPLYWRRREGEWKAFGLHGMQALRRAAPVSQVSYFEADAYARWAGARLPRESEWELSAKEPTPEDNLLERGLLQPRAARVQPGAGGTQFFGDVWEWTESPYQPYPGYRPGPGALGEYNGKFMVNQYVLRGGSCVTSRSHIRSSYRNFFPAHARWQWSGIRLARDA